MHRGMDFSSCQVTPKEKIMLLLLCPDAAAGSAGILTAAEREIWKASEML